MTKLQKMKMHINFKKEVVVVCEEVETSKTIQVIIQITKQIIIHVFKNLSFVIKS